MDIEGKHFPDEEDEHSSKAGKKFGKIAFRFFAICSAIVYIICFARIFSSCDSSLLEEVTFSDKAIEIYNKSPKDFKVYKIYTKDFMEYYGTITISEVVYAETAGEIELGIKYNPKITNVDTSKVSGTFDEYPLIYKLYDKDGNEYSVCNRINTKKGTYKFERIAFSGLNIDFSQNYLNVSEEAVSGEGIYFDSDKSQQGEKYTLEITNPVTNEVHKFVIYDNKTSYKEYNFKPAK